MKDLSTRVKQECQSSILSPQVFEPSDFEKGMLTSKDNEIRNADVPEDFKSATTGYYFCKRFQLIITMLLMRDQEKVRIQTYDRAWKRSCLVVWDK